MRLNCVGKFLSAGHFVGVAIVTLMLFVACRFAACTTVVIFCSRLLTERASMGHGACDVWKVIPKLTSVSLSSLVKTQRKILSSVPLERHCNHGKISRGVPASGNAQPIMHSQ